MNRKCFSLSLYVSIDCKNETKHEFCIQQTKKNKMLIIIFLQNITKSNLNFTENWISFDQNLSYEKVTTHRIVWL